jgi:predicted DNA-binding transcriptional regulator YafY
MLENIRDLCNCVHFFNPGAPTDLRKQFSVVLDAIMQGRRIIFNKQEMEPYALLNNGKWYVVGYCRRSRRERAILLSEIRNPKMVGHYFAIPKGFKVKDYMDVGVFGFHGLAPHFIIMGNFSLKSI